MITFNDMPLALTQLSDQMDRIEALLIKWGSAAEPDIIYIEEVAKILGLTKGTVYTKVYLNEIPYIKKGARLRFSRKALNEWVMSGRKLTSEEQLINYKLKQKAK